MIDSQSPHARPPGTVELVYQDDLIIVTDKPAGLLAVPGRGTDKTDCLTTRVQQQFSDALSVHRLDMSTSGLMVFARGAEMHRIFSRMFRERNVHKRYIAVVGGAIKDAEGNIELPLSADWPNRPHQKVDKDSGKPCLTRYCVLSHDDNNKTSRVELQPVTGRTHQLRIHLAAIGHPIIGDALYGGSAAERMMLHASRLSFDHPLNGKPISCVSEPPF